MDAEVVDDCFPKVLSGVAVSSKFRCLCMKGYEWIEGNANYPRDFVHMDRGILDVDVNVETSLVQRVNSGANDSTPQVLSL